MNEAEQANLEPVDEWINSRCFWVIKCLIYVSAPVLYVDIVQAALCDKLGANKTVASLPATAYRLGAIAPVIANWVIGSSGRAQTVVLSATLAVGLVLALVVSVLILPFSPTVRVTVVVVQGLVLGFLNYTQQVFLWQCLASGTRLPARAHALKLSFSLGPLFAVASSLGAQFVLGEGVPFLSYPLDFAFLYGAGALAMLCATWFAARFRIPSKTAHPSEDVRFVQSASWAVRDYVRHRELMVLWVAYLLWYLTLGGTGNLSLYVRQALGREPKEFSGLMLALRFGAKAAAGALLAEVLIRRGDRAALAVTSGLMAAVYVWVILVPGYPYLLAFALVGAGELGSVYFANFAVSVSSPDRVAWNLSLLELTALLSSLGPVVHHCCPR